MREERQEPFALGHKKEEKTVKNIQKMNFLSKSHVFCKRFAQITSESLFFKERITHGLSFVKSEVSSRSLFIISNLSERANERKVNSQP